VYDGFAEMEVVRYPDEFAGAFIDKSNKLHIILTKNVDLGTEYDYRKLTGMMRLWFLRLPSFRCFSYMKFRER